MLVFGSSGSVGSLVPLLESDGLSSPCGSAHTRGKAMQTGRRGFESQLQRFVPGYTLGSYFISLSLCKMGIINPTSAPGAQ